LGQCQLDILQTRQKPLNRPLLPGRIGPDIASKNRRAARYRSFSTRLTYGRGGLASCESRARLALPVLALPLTGESLVRFGEFVKLTISGAFSLTLVLTGDDNGSTVRGGKVSESLAFSTYLATVPQSTNYRYSSPNERGRRLSRRLIVSLGVRWKFLKIERSTFL